MISIQRLFSNKTSQRLIFFGLLLVPQGPLMALDVKPYVHEHENEILKELMTFVAIPNVASDQEHIGKNADAILQMLAKRGIQGRLLTNGPNPPAVYAEVPAPHATRTIVL